MQTLKPPQKVFQNSLGPDSLSIHRYDGRCVLGGAGSGWSLWILVPDLQLKPWNRTC